MVSIRQHLHRHKFLIISLENKFVESENFYVWEFGDLGLIGVVIKNSFWSPSKLIWHDEYRRPSAAGRVFVVKDAIFNFCKLFLYCRLVTTEYILGIKFPWLETNKKFKNSNIQLTELCRAESALSNEYLTFIKQHINQSVIYFFIWSI